MYDNLVIADLLSVRSNLTGNPADLKIKAPQLSVPGLLPVWQKEGGPADRKCRPRGFPSHGYPMVWLVIIWSFWRPGWPELFRPRSFPSRNYFRFGFFKVYQAARPTLIFKVPQLSVPGLLPVWPGILWFQKSPLSFFCLHADLFIYIKKSAWQFFFKEQSFFISRF